MERESVQPAASQVDLVSTTIDWMEEFFLQTIRQSSGDFQEDFLGFRSTAVEEYASCL